MINSTPVTLSYRHRLNLLTHAMAMLAWEEKPVRPDVKFDMTDYCRTDCGTVVCSLGMASITVPDAKRWKPLAVVEWIAMGEDIFGIRSGPSWNWLFDADWYSVDNTMKGAAQRILWLLQFGVPEDEVQQRDGTIAELCYNNMTLEDVDLYRYERHKASGRNMAEITTPVIICWVGEDNTGHNTEASAIVPVRETFDEDGRAHLELSKRIHEQASYIQRQGSSFCIKNRGGALDKPREFGDEQPLIEGRYEKVYVASQGWPEFRVTAGGYTLPQWLRNDNIESNSSNILGDFKVVCDGSNNSNQSVDEGTFHVDILIKPSPFLIRSRAQALWDDAWQNAKVEGAKITIKFVPVLGEVDRWVIDNILNPNLLQMAAEEGFTFIPKENTDA